MVEEDVVYIYNGMLLSRKKDKLIPFAITWKDLEGIILSEISQTEKDKHQMISLMWNMNKHIDKGNSSVVTGEGGRGEHRR